MKSGLYVLPGHWAPGDGGFSSLPPDDLSHPVQVAPSVVRVIEDGEVPVTKNDLTKKLETLPLVHPVDRGRILDFDRLEELLYSVLYQELGWREGQEGAVMVADPILTPRADRERLAQIFFEVFNVSGLHFCDAGVLSLYAMAKLNGCAVDIGCVRP